jgi:hypothetical protein
MKASLIKRSAAAIGPGVADACSFITSLGSVEASTVLTFPNLGLNEVSHVVLPSWIHLGSPS